MRVHFIAPFDFGTTIGFGSTTLDPLRRVVQQLRPHSYVVVEDDESGTYNCENPLGGHIRFDASAAGMQQWLNASIATARLEQRSSAPDEACRWGEAVQWLQSTRFPAASITAYPIGVCVVMLAIDIDTSLPLDIIHCICKAIEFGIYEHSVTKGLQNQALDCMAPAILRRRIGQVELVARPDPGKVMYGEGVVHSRLIQAVTVIVDTTPDSTPYDADAIRLQWSDPIEPTRIPFVYLNIVLSFGWSVSVIARPTAGSTPTASTPRPEEVLRVIEMALLLDVSCRAIELSLRRIVTRITDGSWSQSVVNGQSAVRYSALCAGLLTASDINSLTQVGEHLLLLRAYDRASGLSSRRERIAQLAESINTSLARVSEFRLSRFLLVLAVIATASVTADLLGEISYTDQDERLRAVRAGIVIIGTLAIAAITYFIAGPIIDRMWKKE